MSAVVSRLFSWACFIDWWLVYSNWYSGVHWEICNSRLYDDLVTSQFTISLLRSSGVVSTFVLVPAWYLVAINMYDGLMAINMYDGLLAL